MAVNTRLPPAGFPSLQPDYAVISCGKNNRYGHPNPAVLERLEEAGAEILDTREGGEIEFRTDGKTVSVKEFLEN
jgi:competence protein ComEC